MDVPLPIFLFISKTFKYLYNMASFEVVNKALLKVFDCINVLLGGPNNHAGKKTSHNLIKVLLLIRACWKEEIS